MLGVKHGKLLPKSKIFQEEIAAENRGQKTGDRRDVHVPERGKHPVCLRVPR